MRLPTRMPTRPTAYDINTRDTADPNRWAATLDVPVEAVELYRSSDVIDLHLDSYIWTRILRYRLDIRHDNWFTGRQWLGQVDLPRAIDAGLTGGMWSITTNPARGAEARARAFARNLVGLRAALDGHPGVDVVTNVAEYRAARARDHHGAFLAIQGGNALSASDTIIDTAIAGGIIRVTIVHLTSSDLGTTSSPLSRFSRRSPLGRRGEELIEQLDAGRVLVDLAHISVDGFWRAVDVHDDALPIVVTHTGVDGVNPHWRNLDDRQIRVVADSGGFIGIMLHAPFVGATRDTVAVVDHLAHVIDVGGEGVAALGSDYDGAITAIADLPRLAHWPRLVAEMQRRKWSEERIRGILGGNALRTIETLRG